MGLYKSLVSYLVFGVIALFVLFLPYIFSGEPTEDQGKTLNVLSYSSFVGEWGPGPWIAQKFEEKHGVKVRFIDAGNAGLILERFRFKSDLDQPDVILGFDQFSIPEARKLMKWKDVDEIYKTVPRNILPKGAVFHDFFAFDWGPMTFVYREGEVEPPKTLDDLLRPEYHNRLILQDPRLSSPGLQFLFWVLNQKGTDEGFHFLKKLKKSIKILAPSWSSSYSLFQAEEGTTVFSYFTSPLYHQLVEKKTAFRALHFEQPHPVQVEYAGIPESCQKCEMAFKFLKFLATEETQRKILEKNFMLPMNGEAVDKNLFVMPENIQFLNPIESWDMINKKKDLVEKWKRIFY